jgi:DNA polymerase III gamma/tau subunit
MTTNFLMSDEEREESVIERRERERAENGKIDNDELIPLIPNVRNDVRKTIACLQVYKRDIPGDGYKGDVDVTATMTSIARLYGNGVYDFHAVNQDGKVLRRQTGVKIAWVPSTETTPKTGTGGAEANLLKGQAEQHQRETARVESFGRMAVESTRDNAHQHIAALTAQQSAAIERDRAYFASLMAQQQHFFQSMMQQSQQMHQQNMERAREDFRQTIQVVQLSNERVASANDPHLLLNMFKQGLALNADNGQDDEEETESENPWTEAIKAGASAIKDITDVAKINAITSAKKPVRAPLPPKKRAKPLPPAAPLVSPQENTLDSAGPIPSNTPAKREKIFKPGELAEIVRLKKLLDMKGLDFAATVRNASQYIAGADVGTDTEEPEDEPESESGESSESDSAEDSPSDVDRS